MPISKIKGSAIEDDAITSARLDDGTIVAVDLASDAVTTAKIQDGAVTTAKIQDGDVTSAKLDTNIDIAGTLDVTGVATLDDGLVVDNDGATVATFDRATSDGTIIDVQKDGSTVGSIGTSASYLYIGNGDTGLLFNGGGDTVSPRNPSTGAGRDNAIDLGVSSERFKDLYLSGGVYLGGTGSANKLDDYEEGTWTPAATNVTLSAAAGRYVKIGQFCFLWGKVQFPSTADTNASSIGGFPFTNIWGSSFDDTMYSGAMAITNLGSADILPMFENQHVQFRSYGNVGYTNANLSTIFLYFTGTIRVA